MVRILVPLLLLGVSSSVFPQEDPCRYHRLADYLAAQSSRTEYTVRGVASPETATLQSASLSDFPDFGGGQIPERVASTARLTPENLFELSDSNYNSGESTKWVKFALILRDGKPEIIFQNTIQYKFHSDFLLTQPEFEGMSREEIDALTMKSQGRKAYIGTLIFDQPEGGGFDWQNPKHPTRFELVAEDPLSVSEVKNLQNLIQEQVDPRVIGSLSYFPVREQRAVVEKQREAYREQGIDLKFPESGDRPVVYSEGWSVGRVKRAKASELPAMIERGEIHSDDILVLDEIPRDLPPVAGVITSVESSPNSHPALMMRMSGGAFTYLKGAYDSPRFKKMEEDGSFVFLRAQGRDFSSVGLYDGLNSHESGELNDLKKPEPLGPPGRNLRISKLRPLREIAESNKDAYGSKAANYADLLRQLGEKHVSGRGFGIPFQYYERFLKEGKAPDGTPLKKFIEGKLKGIESPNTPIQKVSATLSEIREAIEEAEISDSVLNPVLEALGSHFPDGIKVRFRSSSNAEDSPKFNGAGLYASAGVKSQKKSSVEKGLKEVWASTFNDRAFLARRMFGIPEGSVSMAVLVHPAFKGELARGVSIVGRQGYDGKTVVEVTGFPGEDLKVTNPPVGSRPETTKISESWGAEEPPNVSLVVPSTEVGTGRTLLRPEEYLKLYELEKHILDDRVSATDHNTQLDFEWKLMPTEDGRSIFVKQVRQVPPSIKELLPSLESPIVIAERSDDFIAETGESSDGLLRLFARQKHLRPRIRQFVFNKDVVDGSPIEKLQIELRDGTWLDIDPKTTKMEFEEKPWGWQQPGVISTGDSEQRERTWTLSIPDKDYPSLKMHFVLSEYRKKGEKGTPTQVVTMDDLNISMSANRTDFPHIVNAPPPDYPGWTPPERIHWSLGRNVRRTTASYDIPTYDVAATYEGDGFKINVEGNSDWGGTAKTFFFDHIAKSTVEGLLDRPLVLTQRNAMEFAPAHHNFHWEYAFDLHKVDGITPAEKKALEEKGGRYLVLSQEMKFGGEPQPEGYELRLYNEEGKFQKLGVMKGFTTPPISMMRH